MKLKYKYQGKYEAIIKEDDCDKLIRQVKADMKESEGSCIQVILALSSILEADDMKEYVSRGLFVPVICSLIRESVDIFQNS